MNIKQQAYELFKKGYSYSTIGQILVISKTTAYDYVKEIKLCEDNSKTFQPNVESKKHIVLQPIQTKIKEIETPISKPKIKEFTGDELINKQFDSLAFEGKFLELIGKPSKLFSGIIWGLPKGGKSNFSLRFADYLQEYFGKVAYIAAEEGESVTLQEKFKAIGGSQVTVVETRNKEDISEYLLTKSFDFVFIDSINNAGIDNDYLEYLKTQNPNKSFIAIVQATKGGNFKGDQALTHNCDFIIKVIEGVAYHSGRFNTSTQIEIFKEPLYHKNPNKPIAFIEENEKKQNTIEKQEIKANEVKAETKNGIENKEVTEPLSKEFWAEIFAKNNASNISKPKVAEKPPINIGYLIQRHQLKQKNALKQKHSNLSGLGYLAILAVAYTIFSPKKENKEENQTKSDNKK